MRIHFVAVLVLCSFLLVPCVRFCSFLNSSQLTKFSRVEVFSFSVIFFCRRSLCVCSYVCCFLFFFSFSCFTLLDVHLSLSFFLSLFGLWQECTSNENWSASNTQKAEIARFTHDYSRFNEVMPLLWQRLQESPGNWRVVFKVGKRRGGREGI